MDKAGEHPNLLNTCPKELGSCLQIHRDPAVQCQGDTQKAVGLLNLWGNNIGF